MLIEPYLEARTDGNGKARTYTVLEGLSCSPNGVEVWKTLSDGSISGLTLSGQTSLPDGTIALPSLTFASSASTGISYGTIVGGPSIHFSSNGAWIASVTGNSDGIKLRASNPLTWCSTSLQTDVADVYLYRDNAAILAQRNGTNAQAFRVYNTFTDASNFERAFIGWTSNILNIGTEASGTGTNRSLRLRAGTGGVVAFNTGATDRWQFDPNGHFLAALDATYDIGATGANRPRNGFFSGTLSYGTFTGNADAPVTGFITITDSGGVSRKLAVIA